MKKNVMLALIVGALGFAAGCDFSFCGKTCQKNTESVETTDCSSCAHESTTESHEVAAQEALAADAVSDTEVAAAVEAGE